ncbi:MAG: hypothetical protein HRT54_04955 [Colwellia sp.]|nr:hypothetical protein [Colwellia sp.]
MDQFSKSAMISKMNNLLELLLKITRSNETNELFENSLTQFKWIVNFDYCHYLYFNQAKQTYCFETISYDGCNNIACYYHEAEAEFEKELETLYNKKHLLQSEFNNLPLLSELLNWQDNALKNLFTVSTAQKNSKTSALLFMNKNEVFSKDDRVLMSIFANVLLLNIASIKDLKEKELRLNYQQEVISETASDLAVRVQELALANKYKSQFLANMSHELRSPLNSILLLTKALIGNVKHHFDNSEIEDLQIILKGGQSLRVLIDDIMDLSRIEAGKLPLQVGPVKIKQLAKYLHKTFSAQAQENNLNFLINLDENLPTSIITDESRLAQILRNLLSNAFKFTPHGSVVLKISPTEPQINFKHMINRAIKSITFTVTDSGIGIPINKQQAIFESFQQVDGSDSRHFGGTGLGLTISRELTHLLGGDIQVHSELGSGSTFRIDIPLDINTENQGDRLSNLTTKTINKRFQFKTQASEENNETQASMQANKKAEQQESDKLIQRLKSEYQSVINYRVLLIDTDMIVCFSLSKKLIDMGFEVDFCSSVSEALVMLDEQNYQFLFIEYDLVVNQDLSLAINCQQLLDNKNSIIIVLNNEQNKNKQNIVNIHEVDGQLDKPVQLEDVLVMMKKVLNH